MKQVPEHSIQGYLSRLPAYKLELLLRSKDQPNTAVLTDEDYRFIQDLLRHHLEKPDAGGDHCEDRGCVIPALAIGCVLWYGNCITKGGGQYGYQRL